MTFKETLKNISDVVVQFSGDEILQDETLKLMHRKLSSNIYFLNEHRVQFKKEWDGYYADSKHNTNAAKERFADRMVPHLYESRKLHDAAESVLISINNQLKY